MELGFEKGRYRLRLSRAPDDVAAVQALRGACFRGGGLDADALDGLCHHALIEDITGDRLVACVRLLHLPSGADLGRSYSAGFYDLDPLAALEGGFVELGRFCVAPDVIDPDILRLAWAALVKIVEGAGTARYLIGCSSFQGTDWARFRDALGALATRHLAPRELQPGRRAPEWLDYPAQIAPDSIDQRESLRQMPPLLRSYLTMGGMVSDHAVIDRDLGTVHVFTMLDTTRIPPARLQALRALVQ